MDERQFTQAVRQYQRLLLHIAYAMLRHPQDCADAVQDALMAAWHGRGKLRDPGAVKAWLTRILINSCNETLRKRKKAACTQAPDTLEAPPDVEHVLLHDALGKLQPELRMPILLYYLEGFSVEEVGRILRIPTGTVKSRMARGRRLLSAALAEEDAT